MIKWIANLTLGKKIMLLFVFWLAVGTGIFSYLSIRAVHQATEVMLEDRMTTAHTVVSYLDWVLEIALNELRTTAQAIGNNSTDNNLEPKIKNLEEAYQRLTIYINSVYLVNSEGRIVWSKPENIAIKDNYIAFHPGIYKAINQKQANISSLVSAPSSNTPVIFLSSPTGQEQQSDSGALVVAIDLTQSSISGFIQPIRLGQTGYVEIVDENGVVVARTLLGPRLAPFEQSDHSGRFAELIEDGKPTRGLCHTCHTPAQKVETRDVLAFVPLSAARWGVIIRQSEQEALAPVRQLRQNLLLFGSGLGLVATLFVIITTRGLVKRISLLIAVSRRIAGGDLISPISFAQKDELGVLAETFEDMRTKLRTSYGELEQKTMELSSLLSVAEVLSHLSDLSNLDAALGSAMDKTLEIMKANTGGILLLNEEEQKLYYKVHRGLSDKYAQEMCLSLGEGIAGKVAQTGEAIVLEDLSTDARAAYTDLISAEGLLGFASVPLRSKNKVLGVLNIAERGTKKFSPDDIRLLEGIAGQIATTIENVRLHQELQHKDEVRGELLRQIMSIQEEERKRIARELHDETSQVLTSLTANLEVVSSMLSTDQEDIRTKLREAQALSISALEEIHRLIYELRPSLLDDLGLVTATRWLAENNLQAAGIKVNLKTSGRVRRLDPQVEITLFRVIQEAIYNITRHAKAKNVNIEMHFKKNDIRVYVRDDGIGFDVEKAIRPKDRPRGWGLLGMMERVELMNGTFNIQSHPGGGTEINLEIPRVESFK